MNPAGELKIRATYADGQLRDLAVKLERPAIARLFVGQPPNAVLKTVPYLYTLCAEAQRAAAQAALAAAGAAVPAATTDHAGLWVEFLHETLWRLLLDWPAVLGIPPAQPAFIAWRVARHGEGRLAATQALLDGALADMAQAAEKHLLGAVDRSNDLPAELPTLTPGDWLGFWLGLASHLPDCPLPASIASAWHRRLAEARLAGLALADGRPFPLAGAGEDGFGIGQAWTARGLLTHAVHIDDDQVAKYRVWAPTDRLFADATALSHLLADSRFADAAAARQGLEQAILALDPCLPYTLEFSHA